MRFALRASIPVLALAFLGSCRVEIADEEPLEGWRRISPALRASCPAEAASRRMARDVEGASNPTFVFESSIYDTTGWVVRSSVDSAVADTAGFRKRLVFPSGVGTGRYFLFYQIRDTTKTVVREDSLCFFVKD